MTPQAPAAPTLDAELFDGRSAAARPVRLHIAQGQLHVMGDNSNQQCPLHAVRWPERERHGRRLAYLPGGAMLVGHDARAWDDWAAANGLHPSWLVRCMQSWRAALAALLACVLLLGAAYRWGTPWAAQAVLAMVPPQVDADIGEAVLAQVDTQWFQPSALPQATQDALRARLAQAVQRAAGRHPSPAYTLHFRATPPGGLGANALALPGGQLVVTDAMVKLLADRPDALIGVLGHELGHVARRHGMRSLVQASLLAALSSAVVGDVSSLITAAPALLGQMAYARDFEREADDDAIALMRANGLDPAEMALMFERLQAERQARPGPRIELPIALSSHPADAERMARLRGAASQPH